MQRYITILAVGLLLYPSLLPVFAGSPDLPQAFVGGTFAFEGGDVQVSMQAASGRFSVSVDAPPFADGDGGTRVTEEGELAERTFVRFTLALTVAEEADGDDAAGEPIEFETERATLRLVYDVDSQMLSVDGLENLEEIREAVGESPLETGVVTFLDRFEEFFPVQVTTEQELREAIAAFGGIDPDLPAPTGLGSLIGGLAGSGASFFVAGVAGVAVLLLTPVVGCTIGCGCICY